MSDRDDLKSHEEMWQIFTKLIVYSSVAAAVALLLLLIFVA